MIVDWTKEEARKVAERRQDSDGRVEIDTTVQLSDEEAAEVADWIEDDFSMNDTDSDNDEEAEMVRLEAGETLDDRPESLEDMDTVERVRVWELGQ